MLGCIGSPRIPFSDDRALYILGFRCELMMRFPRTSECSEAASDSSPCLNLKWMRFKMSFVLSSIFRSSCIAKQPRDRCHSLPCFYQSQLIRRRLQRVLSGQPRIPITMFGPLGLNVAEAEEPEPHFPCAKHAKRCRCCSVGVWS